MPTRTTNRCGSAELGEHDVDRGLDDGPVPIDVQKQVAAGRPHSTATTTVCVGGAPGDGVDVSPPVSTVESTAAAATSQGRSPTTAAGHAGSAVR